MSLETTTKTHYAGSTTTWTPTRRPTPWLATIWLHKKLTGTFSHLRDGRSNTCLLLRSQQSNNDIAILRTKNQRSCLTQYSFEFRCLRMACTRSDKLWSAEDIIVGSRSLVGAEANWRTNWSAASTPPETGRSARKASTSAFRALSCSMIWRGKKTENQATNKQNSKSASQSWVHALWPVISWSIRIETIRAKNWNGQRITNDSNKCNCPVCPNTKIWNMKEF